MKENFWDKVLYSNLRLLGRIILFLLVLSFSSIAIYLAFSGDRFVLIATAIVSFCLSSLLLLDLLIDVLTWVFTGEPSCRMPCCSLLLVAIPMFTFKFIFGDWYKAK